MFIVYLSVLHLLIFQHSTSDTYYTLHSLDDTPSLFSTTHKPTPTTYYAPYCTPQLYGECSSTMNSSITSRRISLTLTRGIHSARWRSYESRCIDQICGRLRTLSSLNSPLESKDGGRTMSPLRIMGEEFFGVAPRVPKPHNLSLLPQRYARCSLFYSKAHAYALSPHSLLRRLFGYNAFIYSFIYPHSALMDDIRYISTRLP